MRNWGILRSARCVAVVAVVAIAAQVAAFDLVIPIPKPSLPPIPTPSFLARPGKKLTEEEVREAQEASDRRRDTVRMASEPRQATFAPGAPGVASSLPTRANDPQRFYDSGGVDLSPSYSAYLPYCMVLGRVVCESNVPLDSVAGLQAELVQLQIDLTTYLQIPTANEKIELCVFKDRDSYTRFITTVFPGAPVDRPALYIRHGDKPGTLMVQNDANLIVNVRHEMTHAYLNATHRNIPIWLDEGLAKYFETPPGERGFRNPYLPDVEDRASGLFSSPPSLSRLEKLTRVDQMRSREYRESWSWVHFMLHYSPATHRTLVWYLSTLRVENQRGVTSADAYQLQKKSPMKTALSASVPDFERKYVEHFRNWDKNQAAYENRRAESEL